MSKYQLLRERIVERAIVAETQLSVPQAASREQLSRVHDDAYINRVYEGSLARDEIRRIGFPWTPEMVERSRRSVGATIAASRAALDSQLAVNLAGGTHHASEGTGQGYCVFNDVAVAIRDGQAAGRFRRAAVIDCDVHHGNGTAAIFADDDSVFTFSMHSAKAFPLRKPPGDLDLALESGTGDVTYLEILHRELPVVLERFQPELVFYLAGADPYRQDTLGLLDLTKEGLRARDRLVLGLCRERSIPVAISMAGGYSRDVTDIVDIHAATVQIAQAEWQRAVGHTLADPAEARTGR